MSDDATFDNYHVTTVNPGGVLLFITFLVCALCFVVGCLLSFNDNPLGLQIGKDTKNTREGSNSEEKAPNTIQKKLGTKNDGDYHLQQEDENHGLLQTRTINEIFQMGLFVNINLISYLVYARCITKILQKRYSSETL